MISVNNATCEFALSSGRQVRALDSISVTIPNGQFVCLLGRSGHGKSTLLRSLAGLNQLTGGTITVNGNAIDGPGVDRGMVFQEDTVFPWMTVRQNVEFGLRSQGHKASESRDDAMRWLAAVGLADYAGAWPKELSGGMRKRVAIATAFASGAPILMMDEPFGPLDYVTRRDLQNLLIELWQKTGRTIVFVTHDIEESLVLAERIVVLRQGRVVDDIMVDLPRPRDEEVRASTRGVEVSKAILSELEIEVNRTATPMGTRT